MQVEEPLVCTRRVDGLRDISLRVLRTSAGKQIVAVDPVGACLAVFCLECLIVVFSVEAYKFAIEPVNGSIAAVGCTAWICLIGG